MIGGYALRFEESGGMCFFAPRGRFTLIGGTVAYIAHPDESGWVSFPQVQPGTYRLIGKNAARPGEFHFIQVSQQTQVRVSCRPSAGFAVKL